ncbi:MAG TPA: hypothetical protein DCX25_01225 [Candidatus Pacebacteria bacterium]|nr:MAG: hypothetical protein UX00_C0010G0033 [Microgenomates group bacterium GW2011_GWB1_45_17]KKU23595.1 MAG: hypothetical protein UX36_C0004G0048 [Microgenomates group bacterium GW2011_GWC1_46_15]KKU24314.1 MAG: hypothetical protein UX35_C0002G0048 [Microgenomates group bacterium GW2011_GWA1_46_15]HAV14931.1 hypothetical protein [Candidatus Paceibacterota bacterium]HCR11318.1 hypothetical protein [Candidatus Paceibacterota bacterium]
MAVEAPGESRVEVPETLRNRQFFLARPGVCAVKLQNGLVVELPVGGKINPEQWGESFVEYVNLALLALEAPGRFARMQEYTDGRVSFPIAQNWFGWGRERIGANGRIFTLFGSYH